MGVSVIMIYTYVQKQHTYTSQTTNSNTSAYATLYKVYHGQDNTEIVLRVPKKSLCDKIGYFKKASCCLTGFITNYQIHVSQKYLPLLIFIILLKYRAKPTHLNINGVAAGQCRIAANSALKILLCDHRGIEQIKVTYYYIQLA